MSSIKRFKKIYVEITNVCNLSCSFCPETGRAAQFMTKQNFETILQKIRSYTQYLYLHVKGEPLLHPDLKELLNLCETYGFFIQLTTNGTLLKSRVKTLASFPSLRQINISLHSFEANAPSKSRSVDEYLNNVFSSVQYLSRHSAVIISLRLWNLENQNKNSALSVQNQHILDKMAEFFPAAALITPDEFSKKHGILLTDRIYLNPDAAFDWPSLTSPFYGKRGYCYGLKNHLAILCDGTAVPCCLDGEGIISLGNLKEQTLEEILNSKRALNLINGFQNCEAVEPLCQRCGYRNRFDKKKKP